MDTSPMGWPTLAWAKSRPGVLNVTEPISVGAVELSDREIKSGREGVEDRGGKRTPAE